MHAAHKMQQLFLFHGKVRPMKQKSFARMRTRMPLPRRVCGAESRRGILTGCRLTAVPD